MDKNYSNPAFSYDLDHSQPIHFQSLNTPFKDHPQFSCLIDILVRKDNHHAVISTDFTSKFHSIFIEAFVRHLDQNHIPPCIRHATTINIDLPLTNLPSLREKIDQSDKCVLVILAIPDFQTAITKQLEILLQHPNCRVFILTEHGYSRPNLMIDDYFDVIQIDDLSLAECIALLKHQRHTLETHHGVLIPDDILSQALSLSKRYMGANQAIETAFTLLDSSAGRASSNHSNEHLSLVKPVLTSNVLLSVFSNWTKIPPTHLQLKFNYNQFLKDMQEQVFGQDAAIRLIGTKLQSTFARIQKQNGPLCSFLFAGLPHSGKKTTARALCQHLFNQTNVLYMTQSTAANSSLLNLKMQSTSQKHSVSLKEIIAQTPFSIIMLNNIEKLSEAALNDLNEILHTGLLRDTDEKLYDFSQIILILSTAVGSEQLIQLSEPATPVEEASNVGLMQLVMEEQQQEQPNADLLDLPGRLTENILPILRKRFPFNIKGEMNVIPFLPLNAYALEPIISKRLNLLCTELTTSHGIELSFSPEILRFLCSEAMIKQMLNNHVVNLHELFNSLYRIIENTISNSSLKMNSLNKLLLQLNENGQIIHCQ